jgi:NADH:ubiquinone oxidoreductase subunit F (NADH-binding)
VAGEESALVAWLDKGRALPSFRPDKSVPLEVSRRPALVHNAETMSQIALIARHGAAWFRQRGTVDAPGSTLVTISGAVDAPGVFEVDFGTPLSEMLGWARVDAELSGVLLGGYGGAWLKAPLLEVPYTPAALTAAGATLGVGIVIALPAMSCGLCETARIARYMAEQSAGQCGPCVFGLPALAGDLEQLARGSAEPDLVERIWARADAIEGRGACRHPDGVVRLVRSALDVFADDVVAHAHGRPCTGVTTPSVLPKGTKQAGRIS